MKDRIRLIMESQKMTQQEFAQFIDVSPATLSSIFTGRTKPSLSIVEGIKSKLPHLSTDWLMFGREPMFDNLTSSSELDESPSKTSLEPTLNFNSPTLSENKQAYKDQSLFDDSNLARSTTNNTNVDLKYFDKKDRKITEIRIFYDDQTWETFVPKK